MTAALTLEFVNEVAPEHGRTSCTDEKSSGNEYFNEFGHPRCVRCALLHRLKNGEWPHKVRFHVTGLVVARENWTSGAPGPWKCTNCSADMNASGDSCGTCDSSDACLCGWCPKCERVCWVRPDGDEELKNGRWERKHAEVSA